MKRLMKILAGLMVIAMMISVLPVSAGATAPPPFSFKDVSPEHPYYEDIIWGVQKGLISGYGDGTFKPDKVVSRLEYAYILYRLWGKDWYTIKHTESYPHLMDDAVKPQSQSYLPIMFAKSMTGSFLSINNARSNKYKSFREQDFLFFWEFLAEMGYSWMVVAKNPPEWGNFNDNSWSIVSLDNYFLKKDLYRIDIRSLISEFDGPDKIQRLDRSVRDYSKLGAKLFQECGVLSLDFDKTGSLAPMRKISRAELISMLRKLEATIKSRGADMVGNMRF